MIKECCVCNTLYSFLRDNSKYLRENNCSFEQDIKNVFIFASKYKL